MDNDESLGMAFGTLLGEFERTEVIPEVDAVRFTTYAANAGTKVTATLSAANTTVAAIQTAETVMDDKEVPYEGRILFVAPNIYAYLKEGITRYTENGDPDVDGTVEMYDRMRIVRVPTGRFASVLTLNKPTAHDGAGGYTAGDDQLNFMIVHPSAVLQVVKHQVPRIFSPQVNQEADAWKLNYRIYHDAWVLSNKTYGIYVHAKATPSI